MAPKKRAKKRSRKPRRKAFDVGGWTAGFSTAAGAAALAWSAYSIVSRDPENRWFLDVVKQGKKDNRSAITVWVPGVSTLKNYHHKINTILAAKGMTSDKCPIAFFPYASSSVPLDLVAAAVDKVGFRTSRPQIVNMQLALSVLVNAFQQVHLVCHSHGCLIVKGALEGLGLPQPRVSISAFGPASIIPTRNSLFSVRHAVNWINREDVLVKYGIMDVPPNLLWNDTLQKITVGEGEHYIIARQSRTLDQLNQWSSEAEPQGRLDEIYAHSCYPYQTGVYCANRPVQVPHFALGDPSQHIIHGLQASDHV